MCRFQKNVNKLFNVHETKENHYSSWHTICIVGFLPVNTETTLQAEQFTTHPYKAAAFKSRFIIIKSSEKET